MVTLSDFTQFFSSYWLNWLGAQGIVKTLRLKISVFLKYFGTILYQWNLRNLMHDLNLNAACYTVLGLKTSVKLPVVITWVDVILALEIIWSSQNIWQQWKEAGILNAVVSFSKRSEQMWNWKVWEIASKILPSVAFTILVEKRKMLLRNLKKPTFPTKPHFKANSTIHQFDPAEYSRRWHSTTS